MRELLNRTTHVLEELKQSGSIADITNEIATFTEFFDLLGMDEVRELEERYGVPDDARVRY